MPFSTYKGEIGQVVTKEKNRSNNNNNNNGGEVGESDGGSSNGMAWHCGLAG